MKRTLLVPTDFDEYAPRVIDFCAGTHERGIIKCVLLYVLDTSGMESPVVASTIEESYRYLDRLADPLRAENIEVVTRVETGNRAYEIMKIAEQDKVDVIVMRTTRKSTMERLISGSISAAVAWGQRAPTLLLRNDLLKTNIDLKKLSLNWSQTLLVPVDYSASSARAVLQCTRFEPDAVGKIRLLHVLNPKKVSGKVKIDAAVTENTFRLSAFASMLNDQGVTTETSVRIGDKCEEILVELQVCNGTGIVIGGGGRSSFSTFMVGSTSRAILLSAPVPVMVAS